MSQLEGQRARKRSLITTPLSHQRPGILREGGSKMPHRFVGLPEGSEGLPEGSEGLPVGLRVSRRGLRVSGRSHRGLKGMPE